MDLKQHIGSKVRAERRRLGLTQEQLAERVGKAVETISNIERGHAYTGLETLEKLSTAMNAPIVSFFEGADEARTRSRERAELENELGVVVQELTKRELRIVTQLAKSLVRDCSGD